MSDALVARTRAVDPGLDLLAVAAAAASEECVFHLELPARGEAWIGVGEARRVVFAGGDRFLAAEREIVEIGAEIAGEPHDLRWLGGFAFSDETSACPDWRELPPLLFFLPELLWRKDRDGCRLTMLAGAGREALLEARAERWMGARLAVSAPPTLDAGRMTDDAGGFGERVIAAKQTIAAGELDKIVLSMRREVTGLCEPSAIALAAAARAARPECATFILRGRETTFLGSSPERLVRKHGADVEAMAIAGSGPRGVREDQDRQLGEALLACAKNAAEHRWVVTAIESALRPLARTLRADPRPRLLRLPEAQHLRTDVTAELADAATPLLEIAGRLHPTPAVCGVPLTAARRRLEIEEPDRGWYAGAIGWRDLAGDGELFVALRSVLLDGSRAVLRAGAGIVAASDPASELAEVEAKLGALLRAPRSTRDAA